MSSIERPPSIPPRKNRKRKQRTAAPEGVSGQQPASAQELSLETKLDGLLNAKAFLERMAEQWSGKPNEKVKQELEKVNESLRKLYESEASKTKVENQQGKEPVSSSGDTSEAEISPESASEELPVTDDDESTPDTGELEPADVTTPVPNKEAPGDAITESPPPIASEPIIVSPQPATERQERRKNLATFQVIIEDEPADAAETEKLAERSRAVERLFSEKTTSLPEDIIKTDKVLEYFERQAADKTTKPLIPLKYINDPNVKAGIDEALKALQGHRRSMQDFIEGATYDCVHGNEEVQQLASKQLVGAKILATYLLASNSANADKEKWETLTEDQKIKRRLAERMLNEIALATLSRQPEISPATAKAHARVFKHYAKTFDIDEDFRNRLLNETGRLQEKYSTPQSVQAEAIEQIVDKPRSETEVLPDDQTEEPTAKDSDERPVEDVSSSEPAPSEPESDHVAADAVDESLKMEEMRDIDNFFEGKSDQFAYDEQKVLAALAENKHSDPAREARRQRYLDIWENELRASHAPDSLLLRITSEPLERYYAQANVAPGLRRFLPMQLNVAGWQELRQGNWRKFRPFKLNRESWEEVIGARADVITSLRTAQAPNKEIQACMQALADRLENMNRKEMARFEQSWWQRLTRRDSSSVTQS